MRNHNWLIVRGSSNERGIWIPKKIGISQEAEADILLASAIADEDFKGSEISGLARVLQERGVGNFFASEIVIPPQTGESVRTVILGEIIESSFDEIEKQGKNPLEYNLWWHSHCKMPVGFSGIDDFMIKRRLEIMLTSVHAAYLAEGKEIPPETLAGPFLSLVANVFWKMEARCDFLYRIGEEHRFCCFTIPLVRPLSNLSPKERDGFLKSRLPEMRALVSSRLRRRKESKR